MSSSFSLKAYTEVLSWDFFYPSTCKLDPIEDRGSIRDSLDVGKFNIFDKEVTEIPLYLEISSVFARSIATFGIGLVVAPIGVLWNGTFFIGHIVVWLIEGAENPETWKKVEQYASAFFADFCFAAVTALGPAVTTLGWLAADAQLMANGILLTGVVTVLGTVPDIVLPYITNQNERAGLYKSIMLKSEFGIVSEKGKLLSFDPEKDQEFEEIEGGHFGKIYAQQADAFLELLNRLQKSLPERSRLQPCYPPQWERIKIYLPDAKIQEWEAKFLKIESNIKRVGEIIKKCIELKNTDLCNQGEIEFRMPPFPYLEDHCNKFFDVQRESEWDRKINQAIKDLEGINLPEKLQIYADRIKNRATPAMLLDVKEDKTVKKAWRDTRLQVAPDKNLEFPKEAGTIFDCCRTAYNTLSAQT